MESYEPPEDYLALLVADDDDDDSNFNKSDDEFVQTSSQDDQNSAFYYEWKDLHECSKNNLKTLEDDMYRLPDHAVDDEAVVDLVRYSYSKMGFFLILSKLGKINDIVRLCRAFKIAIPEAKPDTWPLLSVKFESLSYNMTEGSFEVCICCFRFSGATPLTTILSSSSLIFR